MLQVYLTVEGDDFEFPRDEEYFNALGFNYSSYCSVCPWCTRVWASFQVDADECFWPTCVPCSTCPWHTLHRPGVPGSLLEQGIHHKIDLELLNWLPDSLIYREMLLHVQSTLWNGNMLSPEDLSKLQLYRARISTGEQLPIEEVKEAVRLLRNDRMNAAKRSAVSKSSPAAKKAAAAQNANTLLGKLGISGL